MLPGRWIRIYDGFVDVRWFGARGDGATDDTKALQAALDEVRVHGASLFFPPGRYIVTSTLDAGPSQGIRYLGGSTSARATNISEDGSLKQWPTALVWRGGQASSDVLFKWSGSHCIFDGIGFQGGWDSAPNPPGIAFLMHKARGLGTGKASFPRIQISHAAVGFQCGEFRADDNCDTCDFGRIHFKDCRSGFRLKNDQGVAHSFGYAKFDDTDVCFDIEAGGPLRCSTSARSRDARSPKHQRCRSIFRLPDWFHHTGRFAELARRLGEAQRDWWSGSLLCDDRGRSRGYLAEPRPHCSTRCGLPDGAEVGASRTNVTGGMTFGTQSTGLPSPLLQLTGTAGRTCSAIFDSCGLDDTDPSVGAWLILAGSGPSRHRALRDCYIVQRSTRASWPSIRARKRCASGLENVFLRVERSRSVTINADLATNREIRER